ncbi:fimbria/pilus periplasmic chaperone [Salmonella enterica subsp. enterica]|uniref:fimbria/pilus periplasmic chaperone n=1 Tax=Salmonella enterica TaxID=28901 RepID=UPI000FABDD99|nr:fimbria/pilus periplasmic chaperone [Salmonella enterica]EBA0748893.1 fimbrial chaperone protein StdC [Salmonella enterica subsp. enterica]EBC9936475.1 fimbrial chaperone protein StdC [Salmonella enterica subsp. enterica serovar Nigeria]EHL9706571.1 fimbria/pilus periplasmic chaperone [Salmonella enterica subsp. enterica serovar Infantis]EBB5465032.1 fimbrial chaperone protein StdC [Salmonella enterica subsp. enterica]EBE4089253.1 fimbrial chaperone protein StdC [Salmonella enterica subsp. 
MKQNRLTGAMLFALAVAWSHAGQAAINVDRTRIIMNSKDKAVSITLSNDSKDTPFLAQSWVDDNNGKRTNTLMVLPPLQRIDGGQKAQVRITQVQGGGVEKLPQDRETLFWFNVRGVPPKPETSNVLQLALQSRLKLFYRPSSIVRGSNDMPEKKLVVEHHGSRITLNNPTPYYLTVAWLGPDREHRLVGFSEGVMVPPLGTLPIQATFPSGTAHLWVGYIDDYGGLQMNRYTCDALRCVL